MSLPSPLHRPAAVAVAVGLAVGPLDVLDNGVRVALGGELDLASAPQLADGLAALTAPPPGGILTRPGRATVLLDLTALGFLDTSGLAALVDACDALSARGWRVCLSGPRPGVRRLLDIAVTAGWLPTDLTCHDSDLPRQGLPVGLRARPALPDADVLSGQGS